MKAYRFKGLLTEAGWVENVSVSVNDSGKITSIGTDSAASDINGYAIPGFQNAHSHAFQYAMAGLAETHSTAETPDDFWSWRDAMYKLALSISPDHLENIAKMLYSEMLRHGYTDVAEFHYVHHDKDGTRFDNLSEMGERLVSAAKYVGIGITLVPIFYQKGGFGKPPTDGQKRFISKDVDAYLKLLEASEKSCSNYIHANVAIGIHSMRGVEPNDIKIIAESVNQNLPFHIHVSEQLKEIEDSLAYLNKRPVEWMLDNIDLSERFHLVHATHLTGSETERLAKSGANVVLCPSTEGNLGDGIFPLKAYQDFGGSWSIGTDSHIGINPLEELRLLDYGQRLIGHKRNTFYSSNQGDSGTFALNMALIAGRKAMNNFEASYFKVGADFDAVIYDAKHPLIENTNLNRMCSTLLYTNDSSMNLGTISKGIFVVKDNSHEQKEEIRADFKKTIKELANR